jgi:hypothetical protein
MATKQKQKKPAEKRYTFEEYRKAFCDDPKPSFSTPDPEVFGRHLAKEALGKLKQTLPPKP